MRRSCFNPHGQYISELAAGEIFTYVPVFIISHNRTVLDAVLKKGSEDKKKSVYKNSFVFFYMFRSILSFYVTS